MTTNIKTTDDKGQPHKWWTYGWIAFFYDAGLKLRMTTGIDKRSESFMRTSISPGIHQYGNKPVVLGPAIRAAGSLTMTYAELDLKTGKFLKSMVIDELRSGPTEATEAGATIWFSNSFLVEQMNKKLFKKAINANLYSVSF